MINFNMLLRQSRAPNREFTIQSYKNTNCGSCGKKETENNNQPPYKNISKNMNEIVNSVNTTNNITITNNSETNEKLFKMPKIEYFGNNIKYCKNC